MAAEPIPGPPGNGETLTARQLAQWTRLLLAHALRQEERKAALRAWAQGG